MRRLPSKVPQLLHLWTTPILALKPRTRPSLNEHLNRLALETRQEFDTFLADNEIGEHGNNVFYDWQSKSFDNKTRRMDSDPHFKTLTRIMRRAALSYLKQLGKENLVANGMEIFVWTSVHARGSEHLSHVHPESLLSGVYYSQVPSVAGKLLFEDPRGPLPPFHNRFTVVPTAGELVMFPSWLPHQVTTTISDEPRISWSFNVLNGDWGDTAALMVGSDS